MKRYSTVTIAYQDENGQAHQEEFQMPEAVIVQHEMDHLEGKLFIDKLLAQKGKLFKVENPPAGGKEELVDVEI